MKRSAALLILISILLAACLAGTARGADQQSAISEMRLTPESLPHGMSIVQEIWASKPQLLDYRIRIGFPLKALFSQMMIYDNEQARVQYLLPPDEEWLDFGYSKLTKLTGDKSLVLSDGKIIVQIAATSPELQDRIARLLKVDPLHYRKIRIRNLPKEWRLISERYLSRKDIEKLEQKLSEPIQSMLVQEFLVAQVKMKVAYYNCGTPTAATEVVLFFENEQDTFQKWTIDSEGPIVVLAKSQDEKLNQHAMALVNW